MHTISWSLTALAVTAVSFFNIQGMSLQETEIDKHKLTLITDIRSAIEDTRAVVVSPQGKKLCVREVLAFIDVVMKHEEDRLFRELEDRFGIEKEELLKRMARKRVLRPSRPGLQIDQTVPVSLAKRVRRNLELDFKMDGLELRADRKKEVASYKENVITVHQKFHAYDNEAQHSIIGHETMHALHDDPTFMTVLEGILRDETRDGSQKDIDEAKAFLMKWSRFVELRADIKTSSISQAYAKGIALAAYTFRLTDGEGSQAYPSSSERERIAKQTAALHQLVSASETSKLLAPFNESLTLSQRYQSKDEERHGRMVD